ncbi:hypothetical protein Pfo_026303 [Paulownia fortunei]|nr:hypothetical protein Pfo_026303 [Paulownia fortunei]
MGNQNTSGIVVEEKGSTETPHKSQEASSPDDLIEENQILIHIDKTKDFQEKAADSDSLDDEPDKSLPVESIASGEKEVSEEANGFVHDCETRAAASPNSKINHQEPKESNLDGGISNFNNEVHDHPSSLKGEIQRSDLSLGPKSTSTITPLNSLPHKAVNITSKPQEDRNVLEKETMETLELSDSGQIEEERGLVDTKQVQSLGISSPFDVGDHDVEKKEDDLVVTDMASFEVALFEMSTNKEKCDMVSASDKIQNGIRNERRSGDPIKEGPNSSVKAPNHFPRIHSFDSSAAKNEPQDECLVLPKEKLMVNELVNGNNVSYSDQAQPPHQAMNQLKNCSNAQPEMIQSDAKKNGEEPAVGIDSLPGIGSVQREGLITMAKNQEEDKKTGESIPGNLFQREGESSATGNKHESERDPIEKCTSQSQFSLETRRVTEHKLEQYALSSSKTITEAEISPSLCSNQYPHIETPTPEATKSEIHESEERLSIEPNPNYKGIQVELRKSPSFDFGLPFDARSEEYDQTPLLYKDMTAMRSFSCCSALRFQNTSVQTEYLGKSLQYEALEVQEKTIRIERSISGNSRAPYLNLVNKEEKLENVVTQEKQENSAYDKKQENCLKASPSSDDCAIISPKGNGKRKPRPSSFFTNCMCCTAAIS